MAKSTHLACKDLQGYLKTLPSHVLLKLYTHPATCLAVFRELPTLARIFVLRILYVEQPVSHAVVTSWVSSHHASESKTASKVLSELKIWLEQPLPGGLPGWILNKTFRENLRVALLGGGSPWIGSGVLTADRHSKDTDHLDNYAKERWECVLHYMVGSREGISGVSREVIDILLFSGLMKKEEGSIDHIITPAGFQFLLMDNASQVWYFMLQYINTSETRGMDMVETLSFLFQLSFTTFGKDYSTESMSENQLRVLQHLREFGLVYQRKRKSQRFYPTRLAINLASGLSSESRSADQNKDGYLVVETNYRIYAYTDSALQIALLALFCDMLYRFPNMCVANLTRDSVRRALTTGITADQIIHYLKSHAHPEMLKQSPVLPSTVTDQIRLWELERDRFKFSDGYLYNQFLTQSDFELLRDYAQEIGVLLMDNTQKRWMVVSLDGHENVKRFWKAHKNSS